jgi:hypothetical protein
VPTISSVAAAHHVPAGLGAEDADGAGDPGDVVRHRCLAQQGLGQAGLQLVRYGDEFGKCMERAGAHQDGDFLALVENAGGPLQVDVERHDFRVGVAGAGKHAAVFARRIFVGQFLQIVGQDHHADPAPRHGDSDRTVEHVAHLGRLRRFLHVFGDIGKHTVQVDFLLVMGAANGARRLAADGQHRHVVQLGVVEAGEHVGGAGAAGRQAHAQLTREFGMRSRHECGHFFMTHLNEFNLALQPVEGAEDAVDAISRVAVNPAHTPFEQALDEKISHCLAHVAAPSHGCNVNLSIQACGSGAPQA